jgi:hypothetical protein
MISLDNEHKLLKLIEQIQLRQEQLERLIRLRVELADRQWFSTDEVAKLVDRRPFTVREWCRKKRMLARKRETGRGNQPDWQISACEVQHFRDHGLRPEVDQSHA